METVWFQLDEDKDDANQGFFEHEGRLEMEGIACSQRGLEDGSVFVACGLTRESVQIRFIALQSTPRTKTKWRLVEVTK